MDPAVVEAVPREGRAERGDLAAGGHEPVGADGQPDAAVAERDEVVDGRVDRGLVVGGDEGRVDLGVVAVDQHDRDAGVAQPLVPPEVGLLVGVQAGDEHDAVHGVVQQHLDVPVLGRPAGGLRAQQRREPLLGEALLDGVDERGEHRVGQLRHHEPDQAHRLRRQATRGARSRACRARRARTGGWRRRRRAVRSARGRRSPCSPAPVARCRPAGSAPVEPTSPRCRSRAPRHKGVARVEGAPVIVGSCRPPSPPTPPPGRPSSPPPWTRRSTTPARCWPG